MSLVRKIQIADKTLDIAGAPLSVGVGSLREHTYDLLTSKERTYTVLETNDTEIDFFGGKENPGYEHYILVKNTGIDLLTVHTPSGSIGTEYSVNIDPGKFMEFSYIYTGTYLVFTCSSEMTVAP